MAPAIIRFTWRAVSRLAASPAAFRSQVFPRVSAGPPRGCCHDGEDTHNRSFQGALHGAISGFTSIFHPKYVAETLIPPRGNAWMLFAS